ncbi:molybdopterin molybdotransferase MoeA [Arcanobacterium hippocoleae]
MKTVAEHKNECLAAAKVLPPFEVTLADSVDCVLAQDVSSLVDVPQLDLAGRDGYAVNAADTLGASEVNPVTFPVLEEVYANYTDPVSIVAKTAIKISSGAPLPEGANAVVPIECTDGGEAQVTFNTAVSVGENVRARAEDLASGQVILRQGVRIASRQIAVLASAGHAAVLVRPKPRVVVLSIGDELQEPGRAAIRGKVFDANSHALASAAKDAGGQVFRVGAVPDDPRILREAIEDQLVRADIIITTGGLSYGGGDTLKEVLSPLGSVRFDNVGIFPGRQLGVGKIGDTTIFCLPGAPAAALVSFEVFIRPALRQMAGYTHIDRRAVKARILKGWESPLGKREYVQARVVGAPGHGYTVEPIGNPGRPLLTGMARANCLIAVAEETRLVSVGEMVECIVIDR